MRARHLAGVALWVVLAVLLRQWLEATMVLHALVQLPLLVVSGALLAPPPADPGRPSLYAPAALLLSLFSTSHWMLPRLLDGARSDWSIEVCKLVVLPLAGIPLRWSWPQLPPLWRPFVWSNLVSMLLTLGWLHLAAPARLCSFYLVEEQKWVGAGYLALALGLVAGLVPPLFVGGRVGSDTAEATS